MFSLLRGMRAAGPGPRRGLEEFQHPQLLIGVVPLVVPGVLAEESRFAGLGSR